MRNLLCALLLLLGLLHYVPASANSDTGDYDGGGGGTLPAHPESPTAIYNLIQQSKLDLRLVLRFLERNYDEKYSRPYQIKLWQGERTLLEVLESTDIEIRMDRACLDKYGKERDASIYADRPNAICVSAFRIAPKVVKETARKEVLALILHELSHLLGATEEEAREFQGEAASALQDSDAQDITALMSDLETKFLRAGKHVRTAINLLDSGAQNELMTEISGLGTQLTEVEQPDFTRSLAFMRKKESEYHALLKTRHLVLHWFTFGHEALLEQAFAGKNEATMAEFYKRVFDLDLDTAYKSEKILRIRSRAQMKPALEEFAAYVRVLDEHLLHLNRNLSLNPFPGELPRGPNPWKNFLGKYEVTSKKCVANGFEGTLPAIAFSVHYPDYDPQRPSLRYHTKNGWGDMGGLYNGAGDNTGGAAVRVSGDENAAMRFSEFGTSWSPTWKTVEWKLEKLGAGHRMTQTIFQRDQSYAESKEYTLECVFELQKQ